MLEIFTFKQLDWNDLKSEVCPAVLEECFANIVFPEYSKHSIFKWFFVFQLMEHSILSSCKSYGKVTFERFLNILKLVTFSHKKKKRTK